MTYRQLQAEHVLQLKPLRVRGKTYDRFTVNGDARKVHAAIIRIVKLVGAVRAHESFRMGRPELVTLVKAELGIQRRSILGSLFTPIAELLIAALIQALLPIVIAWLEKQLSTLRGGPGVVDELLGRYAREAAG